MPDGGEEDEAKRKEEERKDVGDEAENSDKDEDGRKPHLQSSRPNYAYHNREVALELPVKRVIADLLAQLSGEGTKQSQAYDDSIQQQPVGADEEQNQQVGEGFDKTGVDKEIK